MHNHKLERIWHFSCLKMDFFYKNESSSDSLLRTQLGLGVRAAFLQLCQGISSLPFFSHIFEVCFILTQVFYSRNNAAEPKLEILLFQLTESRGSISDSQFYPLKPWDERPAGGRLRQSSLQLPSSCYNHFARQILLENAL